MDKNTTKEVDFGVFLALWNRTQNYSTPLIHFRIARWFEVCWAHGETRLLLKAFRGSGKSSLTTLFSAWLLYRDPDLRILVLAAEQTLASKMVRNIRKIIQTHPLTKPLIPKKKEEWAADRLTVKRGQVQRDPSVIARGIHSNITGLRADIIICDDVEVPNTCETPEKRQDLRERLEETSYILVPGGVQIYLGTPHTWESIYLDAPKPELGIEDIFLKDYKRLVIPLIDQDGESSWPEKFTLQDIKQIKTQTGPQKFASQMLLEPLNVSESRLDPNLLRRYGSQLQSSESQQTLQLRLEGRRLVSCSAWWDPSFGSAKGDASVLAVIFCDEVGQYYLHDLVYLRHDPALAEEEAVSQSMQVARIAREHFIPSVTVETNGIGKFLPAILRTQMAEQKVPCAVTEVNSSRAKDLRILEGFDAVLAARALHVHERVYKTPFITEMQDWRPGLKGQKDDGLDAVAGALSQQSVRVQRSYHTDRLQWQGGGQMHSAKTEFEV